MRVNQRGHLRENVVVGIWASGHLGIWEFGNFTRLAFERFDGRAGAARMSVVVVVVVVVMVVVVSLELHFQFFSHTPAK